MDVEALDRQPDATQCSFRGGLDKASVASRVEVVDRPFHRRNPVLDFGRSTDIVGARLSMPNGKSLRLVRLGDRVFDFVRELVRRLGSFWNLDSYDNWSFRHSVGETNFPSAEIGDFMNQPTDPARSDYLAEYHAWLRLMARLQLNERWDRKFDASDIVQQTLLEAWKGESQFRGDTCGYRENGLISLLSNDVSKRERHVYLQ